ncbi:MAG TPA: flagellar motor protein MotB [Terracidiphilus sp.]|jgi:chemotaxis protein MotB|nr:flagellar motor protein MotB [Terracidiphilus sp.]
MTGGKRKGHVNHERWLVSYADFITLLFAFFVVLYAFAKADAKKQVEVVHAIDRAFRTYGLPQNPNHPASPQQQPYEAAVAPPIPVAILGESVRPISQVRDDLEHLRRDLDKSLATQIADRTVAIEMGRDGLVISLREAGFFNSASAAPRPNAAATLRHIAASLGSLPYDVRIEGHTDNVPIHNAEFDSNWELSSARATSIARLFLEIHAVAPDRLSAAGYAEYHPVASNATPEGRAINRRVDIVILPRVHVDLATGPDHSPNFKWERITDQ